MSKLILFQGDSITDCGRNYEDTTSTGVGYVHMVKGQLGCEHPGEYEFINRGISGNRIIDVYARIKKDIINLKPDYMSMLIGVNDVWHEVSRENGVRTDLYESMYHLLIAELKTALPNLRIMIMEPFVLKGPATEDAWDVFRAEVTAHAAAAKRVAEKNGLEFIPLQEKFDEACKLAPVTYWLYDGVHPTSAGHELIAREWIKAFRSC